MPYYVACMYVNIADCLPVCINNLFELGGLFVIASVNSSVLRVQVDCCISVIRASMFQAHV